MRNHNLGRFKDQSSEVELTSTHEDTLLNGEVDWVYLEELNVRSNYFWSPDSSRVAFLQMNEAHVPEYPISDWIPIHATVDKQRYPQPGDPNPVVRVGIVKVQGSKVTWIKLPIAEGMTAPRFGWVDPETLWIETLARDHKHRLFCRRSAWRGEAGLHRGGREITLMTSMTSRFAEESSRPAGATDTRVSCWSGMASTMAVRWVARARTRRRWLI